MIVLSGVLVFVAAGLLVDGVFFTGSGVDTPWQVWASIGVSAAAALLLVAGAVRERRRPVPGAELADGPRPATTPVSPDDLRIPGPASEPTVPREPSGPAQPTVSSEPSVLTEVAESIEPAPAGPAAAEGTVLVVAGRPRYHRAGCRYVEGRAAQPLGVDDARAAGYTACGECLPDGPGAEPAAVPERAEPAEPAEPVVPTRSAPETIVVLVRNRYHRPECVYVSVASERRDVTRAAARELGALPCGVCLP